MTTMAAELKTRQKFINSTETCVRDNLLGLVAANPGLRILKQCDVVIRHDYQTLAKENKVAVVTGGGSGHEPGFGGFVGQGMLTASVAGPVFTSPFPTNILSTLQTAGKSNSAGVLLLVNNYTGDRLTFGLALERARREGIKVEMVVIGEDCALQGKDKSAGRRGLCGCVFVQKIAGALSEEGKSLEEICKVANHVKNNMGTISVSLSSCSLPGKDLLFHLPLEKMELGLGVHGEAGVARVDVQPAHKVVKMMIDHLRSPESSCRLDAKEDDHVAVIVNNLGGLSILEMNIMVKEVIYYLESLKIIVDRVFSGAFMTSLEMAGVSVSVLKVDSDILRYLDSPTRAPAWTKPYCPGNTCNRFTPEEIDISERHDDLKSVKSSTGTTLTADEQNIFRKALVSACRALIEQEKELNSLDSEAGDGDCGSTLKGGAQAILKYLDTNPDLASPMQVINSLAEIAENSMGGCSGAIYSLFFTGGSQAFRGQSGLQAWCSAIDHGMKTVMKYSGAEIGDRTMLDSLHAAYTYLHEAIMKDSQSTAVEILESAIEKVKTVVTKTATMKARAGRASYVSAERLCRPDPGAQAVAIWLQGVLKGLKEN